MRESWWALEALLLILATGFATQIGSIYARTVLKRHYNSLAEHTNYSEDLKDIIKDRSEESQGAAAKALDGYLNQVVATWAILWLDGVVSGILLLRTGWAIYWHKIHWLTTIHILVPIAAVLGIVSIFFFLVYIASKEPFGSESLLPYYGRDKLYPPNVRLTHFRITFVFIYCLLVFAAAMPPPA